MNTVVYGGKMCGVLSTIKMFSHGTVLGMWGEGLITRLPQRQVGQASCHAIICEVFKRCYKSFHM